MINPNFTEPFPPQSLQTDLQSESGLTIDGAKEAHFIFLLLCEFKKVRKCPQLREDCIMHHLKCKTCLSTTDADSRIKHCFTKDFALSLYIHRCEKEVLINYFRPCLGD